MYTLGQERLMSYARTGQVTSFEDLSRSCPGLFPDDEMAGLRQKVYRTAVDRVIRSADSTVSRPEARMLLERARTYVAEGGLTGYNARLERIERRLEILGDGKQK